MKVFLISLVFLGLLAACSFTSPNTPQAGGSSTPSQLIQVRPSITSSPTTASTGQTEGNNDASTPAPLTAQAIEACPVSLPNGKSPSGANSAGFNLGNETETIFTIPWPDGKVLFEPGGAGFRSADGSLAMKWPWYRTIPGVVTISGRRLDAHAPPMPTITLRGKADGYEETGFHPTSLIWPGEGCWEITARAGSEHLTFVTLVIWTPAHR